MANLQLSHPEEACPIYSPHKHPDENVVYFPNNKMELYFREPLIPIVKHYPTYLIWTSDINKVGWLESGAFLANIKQTIIIYFPGNSNCILFLR